MTEPNSLPTRFPCWVRAKYSFSPETKKDLGFVEGDLIECLNAGDGSWWTGRLWRDKRMLGHFPSNFVTVLDENFRPASRATSPLPQRSSSTSPFNNPPAPQKTKTKAFRKPFQAYSAPDAGLEKRAQLQKQESLSKSRVPSPTARGGVHNSSQVPSPQTHGYGSRAPSPAAPMHHGYGSRVPSPAPPIHHGYGSRAPSPAPYYDQPGAASPNPQFDIGSSPPPPPPPHRTAYTPHGTNNHPSGYHTPRAGSPCPPSPAGGMTPSPLRELMDGVMSSLEGMGLSRGAGSPSPPLDPWSPEAFDQTYITAKRKGKGLARPNTSMGIADHDVYDDAATQPYMGGSSSSRHTVEQPPQLSNYVQRMESRLSRMQASNPLPMDDDDIRPAVPPKLGPLGRPQSTLADTDAFERNMLEQRLERTLKHRKSAFEVGRSVLGRTFTTKTNSTASSSGNKSTTTNGSVSTTMTDRSLMSGASASGMSYTSAGSLARKNEALRGRAQSALGSRRDHFMEANGSQADFRGSVTGISYHSSHASDHPRAQSQARYHDDSGSMLGGLVAPKPKKRGFLKKFVEKAKTGAANARSTIASGESSRPGMSSKMPNGVSSIASGFGNTPSNTASQMGLGGGGIDWVQVRRDVNRSNSLSHIEFVERKERCMMMDHPAISPVEELYEICDGDEAANGNPVSEPTNFQTANLSLVDKNARFINSLPPMTNPVSLATGFVCRPYRTDVQRLRAIFTWVSEKIAWEEDFEADEIDPRRVIQTKRGCAEEVAVLVAEMCTSVGVPCEIIQGYLKTPGEVPEVSIMPRPNHWWNAVVVDGEWRIIDCSLASPSNPRRGLYCNISSQYAESWWFLTRPVEICWTHIPEQPQHQHVCPPIAFEVLLALPCACPPFFKNYMEMVDYDTSLIRIEDLEMVQVKFTVPAEVECAAEVEAKAFEQDADGDFFESGEVVKKPALAQAEWVGGQKRYTIKALLPGDEGQGILKIYAGKRGLMLSTRNIPHPLAFALPIVHTGENPPYDFLTRYPTPHHQRTDIYVVQPQCQRLALNNTFVFRFRQHPSSVAEAPANPEGTSPIPFARPGSAMSMNSSSASGSNPSTTKPKKYAKMAVQAPNGKVLRVIRKDDKNQSTSQGVEEVDGGTWEAIIKVGERGTWRGLVLADRSLRWCVFAEWTCV